MFLVKWFVSPHDDSDILSSGILYIMCIACWNINDLKYGFALGIKLILVLIMYIYLLAKLHFYKL